MPGLRKVGFLDNLERPDVDKITGLSPVISIEQKTTNKNPRSTVGTVTEIYDFLRLLYARAGEAFSYVTGERMVKYTEEQVLSLILSDYLWCATVRDTIKSFSTPYAAKVFSTYAWTAR